MFSGHGEEGYRLGGASSLHADGVRVRRRCWGRTRLRSTNCWPENERLPRKQRYTSHKIYEALHESGYRGSESNVRHYIAQRRRERKQPKLYLPLEFDPGADAQMDWGEAVVILAGERVTVQLFYHALELLPQAVHAGVPSAEAGSLLRRPRARLSSLPRRAATDQLRQPESCSATGSARLEPPRAAVVHRLPQPLPVRKPLLHARPGPREGRRRTRCGLRPAQFPGAFA